MLFTDKELDQLARRLPEIETWCEAIRKEITKRLNEGVKFKYCSLEPTRPQRQWAPGEDDVLELLLKYLDEDTAAPRKVLTVAQAEKAVGKKKFGLSDLADIVTSQSSGVKLVIQD